MKFFQRRRRQPPAVIIISLIDILIVLLIFLMVTTTFKQQPAVRIALPESKQAKPGASEQQLVVSVARDEPHFYFGNRAVTFDKLRQELTAAAARNPGISLMINGDVKTAWENIVKVMSAADEAKIRRVNASMRAPAR